MGNVRVILMVSFTLSTPLMVGYVLEKIVERLGEHAVELHILLVNVMPVFFRCVVQGRCVSTQASGKC